MTSKVSCPNCTLFDLVSWRGEMAAGKIQCPVCYTWVDVATGELAPAPKPQPGFRFGQNLAQESKV